MLLDTCPPTVTTTGLMTPSPAGNAHWMLVWVWEATGQLTLPTVTLAEVPKFVPPKVTVPVPAVLASLEIKYEVNCGSA